MTTLNVSLSTKLQATLTQPGVWASAVYFDSSGAANWTPLVTDGVFQGNTSIALPQMKGGKVYFLVSSGSNSALGDSTNTVITKESDISVAIAQANNLRYDSFEFTLQGNQADQGNLTSVVGFGLPMGVSIDYQDPSKPTATVGYNVSGADIFADIQAINPNSNSLVFGFTDGPLASASPEVYRYGVSPANSSQVANPPFAASDWDAYLGDLLAATGVVGRISGMFNGAADANGVWHNQGFFNYRVTSDGTNFWLEPEANSQIRGYVKVSKDDLANSIYATEGNAYVYTNKTDTTPYQIKGSSSAEMNVGLNNQWGELFTQFLTGLSAGFYGGVTGKSPNTQAIDSINLADNWNWDPTYAFGPDALVTGKPTHWRSDPYSEIFFQNSNSYGSGYSDNLMSRYSEGGPLISLGDIGGNVSNINLMLYDDQDVPATTPSTDGSLSAGALSGYTTPVMYNYLPAPAEGYASADATTGANISFSLSNPAGTAGQMSWVADSSKLKISLVFQTASGAQEVSFDATAGGTDGLWQNWSINKAADGTYSISPAGNPAAFPGSFIISQLPLSLADNAISWFRVGVTNTASGEEKMFNMYTTSQGGQFVSEPGALAIDGGALITPQAGSTLAPTFAVNFFPGSSNAVEPSLFIPGGQTSGSTPLFGTPASAVAGTVESGQFTALAGQDALVDNVITTSENELSFGWTGLNSMAASVADWIKNYSNKISAQNTALVTYAPASGSASTVAATADIDGQWQTAPTFLDAGRYTVTMTEYAAADSTYASPLAASSAPLTLTVTGGASLRDAYVITKGQTLQVTPDVGVRANDDISGTVSLLQDARYGSVDMDSAGGFTYQAKPWFMGKDSFAYNNDLGENDTAAGATVYVVPMKASAAGEQVLDFNALPTEIQVSAMFLAYFGEVGQWEDAQTWTRWLDMHTPRYDAWLLEQMAKSFVSGSVGNTASLKLAPLSGASSATQNVGASSQIMDYIKESYTRMFGGEADDSFVTQWVPRYQQLLQEDGSASTLLLEMMGAAQGNEAIALVSKAATASHYMNLQRQFGKDLTPDDRVHDVLEDVSAAPETLLAGMARMHDLAMAELL